MCMYIYIYNDYIWLRIKKSRLEPTGSGCPQAGCMCFISGVSVGVSLCRWIWIHLSVKLPTYLWMGLSDHLLKSFHFIREDTVAQNWGVILIWSQHERESRWESGQHHWWPWVLSRLDSVAWGLRGWAPWWEGSGFSLGFSIPGSVWTSLPLDFFTWRLVIIIPISCLSWISKIRWTVPHT